jgi:hypothetical protein
MRYEISGMNILYIGPRGFVNDEAFYPRACCPNR